MPPAPNITPTLPTRRSLLAEHRLSLRDALGRPAAAEAAFISAHQQTNLHVALRPRWPRAL